MSNDASSAARELPWVVVRVGRSRLGLPTGMVREMMALPAVARVPGLPPDLPGVITWRGQVVPLVDLRVRLQEPESGASNGPRMAVVVSPDAGTRERALVVDGIEGVEAIERGSRAALPDGLEGQSGMVRECGRLQRDGSLVLLLDVHEVLGIVRHEEDAEIVAAPARDSERDVVVSAPAGPNETVTPKARPKRKAATPRSTSSGRESRSRRRRSAS